jgi:uncharacterized protein YjbI with pentapeptide repeats
MMTSESEQTISSLMTKITRLEQQQLMIKKYVRDLKQELTLLKEQFHNRPELQQITDLQNKIARLPVQYADWDQGEMWFDGRFNHDSEVVSTNDHIGKIAANETIPHQNSLVNLQDFLDRYHRGERNFTGINLESADLSGISLRQINLSHANLKKAIFKDSELREVNLSAADLQGSDFSQAQIIDTNLDYANLQQTDLTCVNLQNTTLRSANLQQSILKNATIRDCNLTQSKLIGVNLVGALLMSQGEEVNFSEAKLCGANLDSANFSQSIFIAADLRGANLASASLENANLRNANLTRTILKYGKNQVNLTGAILPDGSTYSS